MGSDAEHRAPAKAPTAKARNRAADADANPDLIATAKLIRRFLPGDEGYSGSSPAAASQLRARIGRGLSDLKPERPSAMRELGLGVLQAWEALSERQRRRKGTADTAILFTDLVGFSTWALGAGDEAAVELLGRVEASEEDAISHRAGIVVKRLGDGSMAVFSEPEQAVLAAADTQRQLTEIEVSGYRPELRAGVHMGRPRKVGKDYLGVDVNIAARVGDAAKGGEILISEPVCELLDTEAFKLGRRRKLKAAGAPQELVVCAAEPRA
jgi:adenylate cyclase